jgi:hypothetical protein
VPPTITDDDRKRWLLELRELTGASLQKLWLPSPRLCVLQLRLPGRSVLAVIDAGQRLVFEPAAVAVEHVATSRSREYGRKVRIMTRGLRCVAIMRQLLDPRRTGFYAVELFSHKVLMRTMAIPLLVAFATSLALAPRNGLYAVAALLQTAFYGLGAVGTLLADSAAGARRIVSLPAYFCLVQVASLHATWNLLRGRQVERWDPNRSVPTESTR